MVQVTVNSNVENFTFKLHVEGLNLIQTEAKINSRLNRECPIGTLTSFSWKFI
mgnify:CR=1